MFSGLIAYNGIVDSLDALLDGGVTLRVRCEGAAHEAPQMKDSIAINGVCLTATAIKGDLVSFDVIPETLERSALGKLQPRDKVNVEYSLRLGDRMGGHFVYGHVDATATVLTRTPEGQGERIRFARPRNAGEMIVEKAFISIDGVSLTVAATGGDWFELALIPETLKRTTLGDRPEGSLVNVEVDPLARYSFEAVHAMHRVHLR